MNCDLNGRVAIVTGAGSGIGRAIAHILAKAGAAVAVCDLIEQAAAQVAQEINQDGGQAKSYTVDVADSGRVNEVVSKIESELGGIHILVNNAGITRDNLLLRMSDEDFDRVLAVNLKGAFNLTRSCCRTMMKARWGRIINISSVIGQMGNAGQANYAAAKAGLIGFTKSVAKELASRNITVNAIAPGFILTAMTEKLDPKVQEQYLQVIPLKRAGTPEDVARLCLFLASEEAGYITGQVIRVDGGMLM
jgi:3-oxoacyl-[acyl-carrier protein] reductase|uniref:3-oxoacyl-[acyl-carrier-protein] reductase n=1 Tax=candidate division WOR-3 bacterium TaxID=2052148 RepID=A0A7V3UZ54_UNCW3